MVFVPVGLNYDRVLEDRTLLLGDEANKVGGLTALWRTLVFWGRQWWLWLKGDWYRFGYACVNFGRPLSAKAFFLERDEDPRHLDRERRFVAVGALAEELMDRVGTIVPALPVSVVAQVLLVEPERAWDRLQLKARVQERFASLETEGASVYLPRGDRDYGVEVGLRMLVLRHVLEEADGLLRVRQEDLDLLRYYADALPASGTQQAPAPSR